MKQHIIFIGVKICVARSLLSRENKAKTWAQHRQTIPWFCFSVTCIGWREIRPMYFEIMNQLFGYTTIEIVQGIDYVMQKWLGSTK